jgi:hypothetical protein
MRLVATVLLLCSLISPPAAGALEPAPQPTPTWHFIGHSGEVTFEASDLAWLHLAFPRPPHDYDVRARIVHNYGPTFWQIGMAAHYTWVSEDGAIPDTRPSLLGAHEAPTRSSLHVWTAAGGAGHEAQVPLDGPTQTALSTLGGLAAQGAPGNATATTTFRSRDTGSTGVPGFALPVEHAVFIDLTPIASTTVVTLSWENTALSYASGPRADLFEFHRSDFNSDAAVGAGLATVQAHASADAQLVTSLTQEEPTVAWFWPRACAGTCASGPPPNGTITSPSGTVRQGALLAWATDEVGAWTLSYPGHARAGESEAPILFGIRAAFPPPTWTVGAATPQGPPSGAVDAGATDLPREPKSGVTVSGAAVVAVLTAAVGSLLGRRR